MKKITIFGAVIIAIAALVLGLAGCGTDNSPSERPIVCLGDSLTEGFGASTPGEVDRSKSYPAFLQSKVTAQVINAGISGDTAAGGLARVDRDVVSKDPQTVIILLGGNDFLQGRPADYTKDDLQAIIDRLRDQDRKIFLASFIGDSAWESNMRGKLQGMLPSFIDMNIIDAHLSEYKKIFSELASENRDVVFIPNIWTGVSDDQMSDPIHPNAEGYSKIADTIYNAMRL